MTWTYDYAALGLALGISARRARELAAAGAYDPGSLLSVAGYLVHRGRVPAGAP